MEYYQDIPRIYTALAEWLSCLIYIIPLKKRFSLRITSALAVMALIVQSIFLVVTGDPESSIWLIYMLIAFLLMFTFLYTSLRLTFLQAGYLCACSIIIAEFMASIEWQLEVWIRLRFIENTAAGALCLICVYSAVFFTVYRLEKPIIETEFLSGIALHELISSVILTLLLFSFSNLSFVVTGLPFTSTLTSDIFNIRTLVDLGGLAIFMAFQSRVAELMAEKEKSNLSMLLRSQYAQYENYRESMDFIHMKYHDLKHQITGLRMEMDEEKKNRWLDSMERELDEHEIVEPTGNQAIDAILGAKLLTARNNDVRFTYVVNGSLLDFMSVNDICTIFGNALDNALESVSEIPEKEKRLVHLIVTEKKGFVLINISNYCGKTDESMKGELPETTKSDCDMHGFGLKSIRTSVRKYDGDMNIEIRDGWFELRILVHKP